MPIPISIVDAFTEAPFSGNPAGVCLLEQDPDKRWMQSVAREMNLAETAFLVPRGDVWALRWFTPAVEVELCGHATLAGAHVLYTTGRADPSQPIRFRTRSGILTASRDGKNLVLDFPATPVEFADAPPDLAHNLGAKPTFVGKSKFDYVVELESEQQVRELTPDLAGLSHLQARGIVVTASATTPGFDFVSRFFAPQSGVPEDPVTGSAHCALTPYWADKLGKLEMLAYQASPRGGVIGVRLKADRVELAGRAVTVVEGQLNA